MRLWRNECWEESLIRLTRVFNFSALSFATKSKSESWAKWWLKSFRIWCDRISSSSSEVRSFKERKLLTSVEHLLFTRFRVSISSEWVCFQAFASSSLNDCVITSRANKYLIRFEDAVWSTNVLKTLWFVNCNSFDFRLIDFFLHVFHFLDKYVEIHDRCVLSNIVN